MASTGFEAHDSEKLGIPGSRGPLTLNVEADEKLPVNAMPGTPTSSVSLKLGSDNTHRRLKSRHIQLIGIGGTIGTALFVQIGQALIQGGPGSLFIAFTIWCTFILAITICSAEMVTYLPISSPFIRFAGRFVDEAFGVAAGYNFFVLQAMLVPFEVVACNLIIHYWSDVVPAGGMIAIILVLYGLINVFAVKWYGESEFWLALGKVILAVGLILYTFITMVGGNPLGDKYGFRFWKDPGSFGEAYDTGSMGKFLGFLVCLVQASFTVAGPDYISMAAGEVENPRTVMPRAYNKAFGRLMAFFVLGSLCVGIVVPYTSQDLIDGFKNGAPGAAASPYVISMNRLRIRVLPDIVNALVLSAAFSAGNSYVYCASRSLFGLALEGRAPKVLTKCTRNGVPIYCVLLVLVISLLSFLQVSSGTAQVLRWFVSVITASQLINFCVIAFTYTRFKKACAAQGISRDSLPYKGILQPYLAWYAFAGCAVMTLLNGFPVFIKGNWALASFFFSYTMVGVFPVLYFGWKLLKRTRVIKLQDVDLLQDVAEIDEYTRNFTPTPASGFGRPVHNIMGATIFVAYVLAALYLSILIVIDLYRSYNAPTSSFPSKAQRISTRLQIFVTLAVLSFSTLSYHMLSYLIYAYQDWVTVNDLEAWPSSSDLFTLSTWQTLLHQIWQWLTESTLFLNFAKTICENSANFWWTQQALFVSMASTLFISIEGTRRQIPHLWAYLAVGQIIPISFAQNLFFVAMIIFPITDEGLAKQIPGPFTQCLPVAAYYIILARAPSSIGQPIFMSIIVLLRMLLLCPFLFRTSVFEALGIASTSMQSAQSGYSTAYILALLCSTVLFVQQTAWALRQHKVGDILMAVNNSPAVSALGYDFILYVVSCAAWFLTLPKERSVKAA
ncbi:MAG: hypothetical protein Q9221_000644 [Calogaya cf. arnoldii]